MPQLLHVSASLCAGNPAARGAGCSKSRRVKGITGGRSDLAVERHAGLQRDQRQATQYVASKSFIEPASFSFEQAGFDHNSGCSQLFEPFSRHFGIWIRHGRDHTLNACCNERITTRRRAALMAMWFTVEIDGAPACTRSSLLQGQNLGMLDAFKGVEAFANELSSGIHYDCAYTRPR